MTARSGVCPHLLSAALQIVGLIQSLFLFAVVWTIGGNTDDEGRKRFDTILRKLIINDAPPEMQQYVTGVYVRVQVSQSSRVCA